MHLWKLHTAKAVLISLGLLFGANVGAQGLERAEALLHAAQRSLPAVRTVHMTSSSTIYLKAETTTETNYQVIDLERRRLYIEGFTPDVGKVVIRYTDDSLSVEVEGEDAPHLAEVVEPVSERLLGSAAQQSFGVIPRHYTISSYDGVRRYADVVEGEQVTIRSSLLGTPTELKLIFSSVGELLGGISNGELILYDVSLSPDGSRMTRNSETYRLSNGEARLIEKARKLYQFNQPVDEALFRKRGPRSSALP